MYNIRLTPYRTKLGSIYSRQTKEHSLLSLDGQYRFWLGDDPQMPEPDFWVVQGKGVRQGEHCRVAPQNTILLTTEPASVLIYPQKYLNQFGAIYTCQEHSRHHNLHFAPAILPWFIGYSENAEGNITSCTLDYDKLKAMPTPDKPKLLSVITSNKAFTQGHIDRLRFVSKLKEYYGDRLDVFGHGFRDFDDKWEVLSQYKYHIVIENSSQLYYWTEKMSDCLLAETFPFYYGCTNMADYVPRGAFEPIDIHNPEQAIQIIDTAIAANRFEAAHDALAESKRLMLDKYNMFEFIAEICRHMDATLPKEEVCILPCRSTQDWRNLWRYSLGRKWYELKWRLWK
ncbi:MAG: hypothetical protein IK023_06645 [Bacteroidaceae bacterium]|nr:hypothetical protein [Bacteroidaceae bacterium]